MNGFNESELIDITGIKGAFFYNTVLTKANKVFLHTKKIEKRDKKVFSRQI